MPSVLVLLPRRLGSREWHDAFLRGEVPDITPYGYHHAQSEEWQISFSSPTPTRGLMGLADRCLAKLCGFDFIHAWRNRNEILGSEIVWTHTEREHLALSLLLLLYRHRPRPLVIAQSVWLMDNWDRMPRLRKWLYERLLHFSDVLTFHSPLNAEIARRAFPNAKVEIVPFGISLDSYQTRRPTTEHFHRPIRILALGNDQHRDWSTFAAAFESAVHFDVRIGSRTFPRPLMRSNFRIAQLTLSEARSWFDWADVLVVPLVANLHASGLTTVLEGVALGIPVIASRAGGLDWYFDDSCITFVEPGDPDALREAVVALTPELAACRTANAFKRLQEMDLSTTGYARRHVELSQSLLRHHPMSV
jgi:glycosyltransferase involved in cell wall biosynthesis